MKKICSIVNEPMSWRLVVEGKSYCFTGSDLAKYLLDVHIALGYTVHFKMMPD